MMVMENGGLDAQVEQRMDAYRGNPQKLQQRYGQNKELLDLLALQKLTSEKKAVAADMQLKQSQQPGTIAQQREQEALDLTKQEMGGTLGELAGRTQGTLGNKQKTQQKNMQKMAQAASRPPQAQGGIGGLMGGAARPQPRPAAPPQAQGIAGARMAQAQQRPPVRMAQGGIVAFAEGQGVSGQAGLAGGQTLEEQIARINARPELNQGQKQELIKQILAEQPKPEAERPQFMVPGSRESSARMPGQRGMIPAGSGTSALDVFAETNPQIAPTRPASPAPIVPTAAPVEEGIASLGPTTRPNNAPAPATNAIPTPEQTAAEFTTPQAAGAIGGGVMPAQGASAADSAFQKGTRMADEYTGRAAANDSYADMKARLAEFDAENYGPRDDLNSFLIGMGGTGSIGSAMKGGYGSMLRSKNNRRNRLMDNFKLEQDRIGVDAVLSKSGIQLGTQLAADEAANERSMRSAAATMGAAKIRAATADADRLADVYAAKLKAVSEEAATLATNRKNDSETSLKLLTLAANTRAELVTAAMSDDQMLQRLNMQLAGASDDPEAAAAIQNNMDQRMQYLSFVVDGAMNDSGLLDIGADAAEYFKRNYGLPTMTTDDVDNVTVEGE